MPEGDGLGDGAGRFNERSLLASQNAPERGTGWSGLIAELHSFEGSKAEDLSGGRQEREWAAVLRPGLLSTFRNREPRTTANEENDENRSPERSTKPRCAGACFAPWQIRARVIE
ncbi:MAG: hypothetical protein QOI53_4584 [Verrucomicrobiota bacterium]|jgi:hypothetical protein|nr:hypothetical protein [Verrucomicrobiota bacterium]